LVSLLLGCGLLAVLVYWLAGRIHPAACVGGLALVAALVMYMREKGPESNSEPHPSMSNPTAIPSAMPPAIAAPSPLPPSEVPPLQLNETLPTYGVNFFEPDRMSSGGVVIEFDRCRRTYGESGFSAAQLSIACTCVVDAVRHNFENAKAGDVLEAAPTWEQLDACHLTHGGHGAPSPFGFPSPRSTREVRKAWAACALSRGEADGGGDDGTVGAYCDCFVDSTLAAMSRPPGRPSQADAAKCETVARYWAATKTYLTRRQFEGIGTTPPATQQQQEQFTNACAEIRTKHPRSLQGVVTTIGADPADCIISPGACRCDWQFTTPRGSQSITAVLVYEDESKNPPESRKMVRISTREVADVPDDLVQAGFKEGVYAFVSPDERVPIRTPQGEIGSVPARDVQTALRKGASIVSERDWVFASLGARYAKLTRADSIARCIASGRDVLMIRMGSDDPLVYPNP
jgi:hypothetical protein